MRTSLIVRVTGGLFFIYTGLLLMWHSSNVDASGQIRQGKPLGRIIETPSAEPQAAHGEEGHAEGTASPQPPKKKKKKKPKVTEDPAKRVARISDEHRVAAKALTDKPWEGVYQGLDDRIAKTVLADCLTEKKEKKEGRTRAPEEHPTACKGAPLPEEWAGLHAASGCDVFTVPFDPASDLKCLERMADTSDWNITAQPVSHGARSVKFTATSFKFPKLQYHIKPLSKGMGLEPMTETASYHIDRLFGLNRVPPTRIVHVPVKWLEGVAKRYDNVTDFIYSEWNQPHVEKTGRGLVFSEWFEVYSVAVSRKLKLNRTDHPDHPGEEVIPVSVQLFIQDVRMVRSSDLAHGGGVGVRGPDPDELDQENWQKYLHPEYPYSEKDAIGMLWESEVALFDYIIGNRDRAPNKNNFIAGGCPKHNEHQNPGGRCGPGPRHPGVPAFIALDQGKTFHETIPMDSIRVTPFAYNTFCVFERAALRKILEFEPGRFRTSLMAVMDPALLIAATDGVVVAMEERIQKISIRFLTCVEKYGVEKVLRS